LKWKKNKLGDRKVVGQAKMLGPLGTNGRQATARRASIGSAASA